MVPNGDSSPVASPAWGRRCQGAGALALPQTHVFGTATSTENLPRCTIGRSQILRVRHQQPPLLPSLTWID